jgi:hypothetical protein
METKEQVLAEMAASFAEVQAVLAQIPPERLTEIGVTEEWSVRDLIAHQAGYERWVAAAIFADVEGRKPSNREYYGRDDAPSAADEATDDTTNAWVVAHARTLPVEQVLAEFEWAHDRLVAAVAACTDAQLFEPARLPFTQERTLFGLLPGQCWRHHRDHLAQLDSFAASLRDEFTR